jgi:hypothetical protein
MVVAAITIQFNPEFAVVCLVIIWLLAQGLVALRIAQRPALHCAALRSRRSGRLEARVGRTPCRLAGTMNAHQLIVPQPLRARERADVEHIPVGWQPVKPDVIHYLLQVNVGHLAARFRGRGGLVRSAA